MSNIKHKRIFSGSIWGILAKIIDAAAKFFTIPMLVGFYGKNDYGLVALAFSLNTYLRLMDMGMNIGSIRFFSMWIAQENWDKIAKVSRSSIVFYGVIGLVNALIFVIMAQYAQSYFNLSADQVPVFKFIMYILAASTVFNWTSNVISQLLSAHGEFAWINRVTIISSVLNFVTAIVCIRFHISLPNYFFLYTLSTLIVIPLNIYKLKVYKVSIISLLLPKWNGPAFKEILGYSVSIFAMGLFQFSADNLRPILLAKYASKGVGVLTEYRIIQTIAMLIIAFAGVFLDVLLPIASKAYAEDDRTTIEALAYSGTKYVSLFISFVVFILVANAHILLMLYMGPKYSGLTPWLIIWLLSLLGLHNSPISSLVLSTGKTKPLIYMSAVSCILSLPITALLAYKYDTGAAVIGYAVYVALQIGFYYFYYTPKVLHLSSLRIFLKSFLPAVTLGVAAFTATHYLQNFYFPKPDIKALFLTLIIFSIIFVSLALLLIVKPSEVKRLTGKILNKN